MSELTTQLKHWITDTCPNVCKIERQLSDAEAWQLLSEFPIEDLKKQLGKMDDWKNKSRSIEDTGRSVVGITQKWFEMDIKKGFYTKKPHPNSTSGTHSEFQTEEKRKEEFILKFPERSIVYLNGETWEVQPNCFLRNCETGKFMVPGQVLKVENKISKKKTQISLQEAY